MRLDNPTLLGVYIASITAVTSVVTNLLTTITTNCFQKNREKRSEIQNIYAGCIKSLATVSTLSGATENNLDNIELSLVEAKKDLSFLLIYTKNNNLIQEIGEEVYLFTVGNYEQFLESASKKGFKCLKYDYLKNKPLKQVLSASDIMLQMIIKNAHKDKRLSL